MRPACTPSCASSTLRAASVRPLADQSRQRQRTRSAGSHRPAAASTSASAATTTPPTTPTWPARATTPATSATTRSASSGWPPGPPSACIGLPAPAASQRHAAQQRVGLGQHRPDHHAAGQRPARHATGGVHHARRQRQPVRSGGVTPTSVACADGSSLTVVVPVNATTGGVRLERDRVRRAAADRAHAHGRQHGRQRRLHGRQPAAQRQRLRRGRHSVLLGAGGWTIQRNYGLDVYDTYDYTLGRYNYNGQLNVTVPNGAPTGPIRVSTVGGTSARLRPEPDQHQRPATPATPAAAPADAAQASANPGQTITLKGTVWIPAGRRVPDHRLGRQPRRVGGASDHRQCGRHAGPGERAH